MRRVFQGLLLAFILSSSAVKADDWGCEVVMCLANPAGPMAASACVPPITRLFAALSKKKPDPFPSCESANGAAVARQGFNYFDPCPQGSTTLESGTRALQVSRSVYAELARQAGGMSSAGGPVVSIYANTYTQAAAAANLSWNGVKSGVGTGEGIVVAPDSSKVCVSGALGPVYLPDNGEFVAVQAYERVTTLEKAASPRYIDVMVDGKQFTRVRF